MPELSKKPILFIINPISGDKDKNELIQLIEEKISPELFKIFLTTGNKDLEKIKSEIENFNPEIIAVAGGDGTCNMVSSLLINTSRKLGIIPVGSANGLATDLNIPKDISGAVDLIIEGYSQKIDVLKINDKLCLHLSDVGFNAKIVQRFARESKRGWWSYGKHLLRELFIFKIYKFEIGFDKNYLKKRAISVTIANSSRFGTGAIINPEGKIDDGYFELCIIKPFPWYYIFPITVKFFRGTLKQSKYVKILKCKTATIRCKKEVLLQIDGEVIMRTKTITASILPGALQIIAPPKL